MASRLIAYKGVTIEVYEQSIRCHPRGGGSVLWFERPIKDADIEGIKRVIDAGRAAMARDIQELRDQKQVFLGER